MEKPFNLDLLIENATLELGLKDHSIVEKDFYVTNVLQALSQVKNEDFKLVFIGGTCLSKCHRLIGRMSEDIDFKIVPTSDSFSLRGSKSRSEMGQFRDEILSVIESKTGLAPKEGQLIKGNNNAFTQIFLDYPNSYSPSDILRPHIRVELTTIHINHQTTTLPISSLIYDVVGKESGLNSTFIECTSLEEAASEKWVALLRRVSQATQLNTPIDKTIIRHLFDLHAIHEKKGVDVNFERLVEKALEKDQVRFRSLYPAFSENPVRELKIGMEALSKNEVWEKSYQEFYNKMVFKKENVSFQNTLDSLEKLNERAFQQITKTQKQVDVKKKPEDIEEKYPNALKTHIQKKQDQLRSIESQIEKRIGTQEELLQNIKANKPSVLSRAATKDTWAKTAFSKKIDCSSYTVGWSE